ADGHDGTCCVCRDRPRRAGHDFGHNGAGSDSRDDRLRRAADDGRHLDAGIGGLARRARPRVARGGLRRGAPLQRIARRPHRGRRDRAAACRRCGAQGGGRARGAPRSLGARCRRGARGIRRAARTAIGRSTGDVMRDAFDTLTAERASDDPALIVDVEGFEGPLDLLLILARQQKVDLARISISALAEQYLTFIEAARKLRLELAADYLVMAAWLAYLKSRLLLPEAATPDGPSAEDMANALAWRLKRLEAFREVATQLMQRPQLQRDIFQRGDPEPIADIKHPQWTATLYDLLSAYAKQRSQSVFSHVQFKARNVWALQEAREVLERMIGQAADWARLDQFLMEYLVEPSMRATVMASSLAATLELVREGVLEVHQQSAFAPIYLRKRDEAGMDAVNSSVVMPRATE